MPVESANFPPLEEGKILKFPARLRSSEASGFSQIAPVIDIPIMSAAVVLDVMVKVPSPTQQKPGAVPVFRQSSRLTVMPASQFDSPIVVASSVPEKVRQVHNPWEEAQPIPEQVPKLAFVSVPVPIMLNATTDEAAVAVAVGEDELVMVLVGTVVAVVVGVTSGKMPFPHPELGISSSPKLSINTNPGRRRALCFKNR